MKNRFTDDDAVIAVILSGLAFVAGVFFGFIFF